MRIKTRAVSTRPFLAARQPGIEASSTQAVVGPCRSHMLVQSLYVGPKCTIGYRKIAPAVRLGGLVPLAI